LCGIPFFYQSPGSTCAANSASTAVRTNGYYGDRMNFFRLDSHRRISIEQDRRAAKVLIAVALCLAAADIITLLRTPFLNLIAVVGLLTSLVLLGASVKLYLNNRPEKTV